MKAYFDHNATTPVDPRVLEKMLPYFGGTYGNPSSAHGFGKAARTAIDTAREQVAELVDCHPSEVIFTSGGTEANNWALHNAVHTESAGTLAVSAIEHSAVLEVAKQLVHSKPNWSLQVLPVGEDGRVSTEVELASDCRVLSVMWANNETGAVQPIQALAERAQQLGAITHTDAVQAVAKVPISFRESGVQMMTVAPHKFFGPKGIGALIVHRRLQMQPLLFGGGHEDGLRPGTENLPAIVGFGHAAALAKAELAERSAQAKLLANQLIAGLTALDLPIFTVNEPRLPNTVQFAVPGMEGETMLMLLDAQGFAVSSGSACSAGKHEPSHVLQAMGVEADVGIGAVRVSFAMNESADTVNSAEQVERFLQVLSSITQRLPK